MYGVKTLFTVQAVIGSKGKIFMETGVQAAIEARGKDL